MCLAVPGRLVERYDDRGTPMGTVDFGGTTKEVCLAFLPDLELGRYAIVHAGFAIAELDEAAAHETLSLIAELDESDGTAP